MNDTNATVLALTIRCPVGCGGPYVVQPGDTLFNIAQRFGTNVQAILACNPQIVNPDQIFVGQVLCVPGAPAPTQPCPVGCGGLYIIQPGDTLFLIAQRFGTTVQQIQNCNPQIVNPNLVHAGTFICVPQQGVGTAPCPPGCGNPYTVVAGDTLFFIAQRFGTTVQAILACNPQITNPDLIFPGQVLCVPGAPGSAPCKC
ncbi:MAG TPA: LysM peptidoglycan-binding domain-containing protein [Limnochordales bacterium]